MTRDYCTMKPLELDVFLCRTDNFGVLVHDPETGFTAAIDAPEEAPMLEAATRRGWKITHIFTTHHHTDHARKDCGVRARPCRNLPPIRGIARFLPPWPGSFLSAVPTRCIQL